MPLNNLYNPLEFNNLDPSTPAEQDDGQGKKKKRSEHYPDYVDDIQVMYEDPSAENLNKSRANGKVPYYLNFLEKSELEPVKYDKDETIEGLDEYAEAKIRAIEKGVEGQKDLRDTATRKMLGRAVGPSLMKFVSGADVNTGQRQANEFAQRAVSNYIRARSEGASEKEMARAEADLQMAKIIDQMNNKNKQSERETERYNRDYNVKVDQANNQTANGLTSIFLEALKEADKREEQRDLMGIRHNNRLDQIDKQYDRRENFYDQKQEDKQTEAKIPPTVRESKLAIMEIDQAIREANIKLQRSNDDNGMGYTSAYESQEGDTGAKYTAASMDVLFEKYKQAYQDLKQSVYYWGGDYKELERFKKYSVLDDVEGETAVAGESYNPANDLTSSPDSSQTQPDTTTTQRPSRQDSTTTPQRAQTAPQDTVTNDSKKQAVSNALGEPTSEETLDREAILTNLKVSIDSLKSNPNSSNRTLHAKNLLIANRAGIISDEQFNKELRKIGVKLDN